MHGVARGGRAGRADLPLARGPRRRRRIQAPGGGSPPAPPGRLRPFLPERGSPSGAEARPAALAVAVVPSEVALRPRGPTRSWRVSMSLMYATLAATHTGAARREKGRRP